MMLLFVVNHPRELPEEIAGAAVVGARAYLIDPAYERVGARVVNLCRIQRYQSRGHYVSLLAEARGHAPLPGVRTIEDLRESLAGALSTELAGPTQEALASLRESRFVLDSYFGRDPAGAHSALAQLVFGSVRAPLLRATFERHGDRWTIAKIGAVELAELSEQGRHTLIEAALEFFGCQNGKSRMPRPAPSVAILCSPEESDPPSNAEAIARFRRAGEALEMRVETIQRCDLHRLGEFDALLIRDTTRLDHYTYQAARRAAADGLAVIDDPDSILRCNNKVFLNELLSRHRVPVPKTLMVHRDNRSDVLPALGLPCILKQPDSAFSAGVFKVESEAALEDALDRLLEHSELVIAQQWLPTEFDWRVGILERRPLYVCKYYMAPGHWQVIKRESRRRIEGSTATLSVGEAPSIVVKTALHAANLIGDGLYGVDLKVTEQGCWVIEINDNPNIDAGNEDRILDKALYRDIMGVLYRRVVERTAYHTA